MAQVNKLGLTSSAELDREEERISKKKAVELFDKGILESLPAGKFSTLQSFFLHRDYLSSGGQIFVRISRKCWPIFSAS